MFSRDSEELDLTLRVVDQEVKEETRQIALTHEVLIENRLPEIEPNFGIAGFLNDAMTEMCKSTTDFGESKKDFLPNYGIIGKREKINLNNTFFVNITEDSPPNDPSKQTEQKEEIKFKFDTSKSVDETEPTHMEIEFATLNGNPFDRTTHKPARNGTLERICREEDIEPVSADLIGREAIVIENLSKEFSGCRKAKTTALENINLTMYEGHITAILGE